MLPYVVHAYESTLPPKKGAIARCGLGHKGLITSEKPELVTYEDGTKAFAWTGIHMGPSRVGKPWSSRKPNVLQYTNLLQFLSLKMLLRRGQRLLGMKEAV